MRRRGLARPTAYRDVAVRIFDRLDEQRRYEVSATVSPGDQTADGTFQLPEAISGDALDAALDDLENGTLSSEATKAFGTELFHALFRGDVARAYRGENGGRQPQRLRLIIDRKELVRLPWELLYDDGRGRFVAAMGPVVRGVSKFQPADALEAERPLRILVLDAFPFGVAKIANQIEADGIRSALAKLGHDAEIDILPNATVPGLTEKLESAQAIAQPFHVLHFIGHGDMVDGKNVLLFEDSLGQRDEVDPERFATAVDGHGLKLVFLNACRSASSTALLSAESFGPALVGSGIPAVIAMQASVFDDAAASFATEFYQGIANNQPVDAAVTKARKMQLVGTDEESAAFGIPVVYLRSEDGRIADFGSPAPRWRTPKGLASIAAGILMVALTGGFVINALREPARMNQFDFNVAVAEFVELDETNTAVESKQAEDLSANVFTAISNELTQIDIPLGVWSPDQTGAIAGANRDERSRSASELADEINADVIVYGTLTSQDGRLVFQPEFYLNDRRLIGATELTGQYEFGSAEQFDPNNIAVTKQIEENLAFRAQALAKLVEGLGFYAASDYVAASNRFKEAERIAGWDRVGGKEILFLFLGNSAGRLGDVDEAERYYAKALGENPEYSRARIGRADVLFQKARDGCQLVDGGGVDVEGLKNAVLAFHEALDADFRPALADVEAKIAFGLGRVYACQAIAGVEAGDGETEFNRIIAEYEAGNDRLRELAWESHAMLALLLVSLPPHLSEEAIVEYQAAIELTTDDERRALFLGDLAWAHSQVGNVSAAIDAYDQALGLTRDSELRARLISQRQELAES